MIQEKLRPADCRLMERFFSLPINAGNVRFPQVSWRPLLALSGPPSPARFAPNGHSAKRHRLFADSPLRSAARVMASGSTSSGGTVATFQSYPFTSYPRNPYGGSLVQTITSPNGEKRT